MQDIHEAGLHFLVDDASGSVWVHLRGRWLYQPHLRPSDARRRGALYVARSEEPGAERAAGTRGDWGRDVKGRVVCGARRGDVEGARLPRRGAAGGRGGVPGDARRDRRARVGRACTTGRAVIRLWA